LRQHPAVSDRLNDLAIADFLIFGVNKDPATTSFQDIARLPPAHTLTASDTGLAIRRYWTLPIEEPVYYRRSADYIDRFKELSRTVVSDRLRTDRVGVFMSGGLDSPFLAATSVQLMRSGRERNPVRAFTYVYDSLIRDDERHYAGAVARHLEIPIAYYPRDDRPGWAPAAATATPEPIDGIADRESSARCRRDMAAHSRVALYGEGPDNALLNEVRPHLAHLVRRRKWGRLAADISAYALHHRHVPSVSTLFRVARDAPSLAYGEAWLPPWIDRGFAERLQLLDRWRTFNRRLTSAHPTRPRAYGSLLNPRWQLLFELLQPSYTGVSLEVRHPYVDIRMLGFLLTVPALPWCRDKHLLRRSMRGTVPEEVRRRLKTPLSGDPGSALLQRRGLPAVAHSQRAAAYGDAAKVFETRLDTEELVGAALRFVSLSHWLCQFDSSATRRQEEKVYEPA
jgi:asparagine synthase (glutamine-hydrolysing)